MRSPLCTSLHIAITNAFSLIHVSMLCKIKLLEICKQSLHDELHWLDVPERVTFKLGLMTHRCLHGQAPRYLADHVTPAIKVASRHRLHSANWHRPRCRLNTYGRPRAFRVAGPTVWNSLPDELRDPACDVDSFKLFFKTILFSSY